MIDTKINQKDCTGCSACKSVCSVSCITMDNNSAGFKYPTVNYSKCLKCGECVAGCPIINMTTVRNNPTAYACLNIDQSVRQESSSGGIFTLLAEKVIEQRGVVFGAGFNEEFDVEHSSAETKHDLAKFRGSKYVQSQIGDSYVLVRGLLESGRVVLFSGTPCQIGGLKSYLDKSYENLLCVDIICHGVPSPSLWKKYVKFREDRAGAVTREIVFRNKNNGWRKYAIRLKHNNNVEYRCSYQYDPYMKAFLSDICLRLSCYSCQYKSLHRLSDITLADFWGIEKILPEMDDDQGTSLVLVNSKTGENMFELIKKGMLWNEVDIHEAVKYNTAAIKSAECNSRRERFFNDLNKIPFDQLVNKYCREKLSARIKRRIKLLARITLEKTGMSQKNRPAKTGQDF